jgi:hypothetical protein
MLRIKINVTAGSGKYGSGYEVLLHAGFRHRKAGDIPGIGAKRW